MKRAALYLRVSTVDQHPETQLHDLRQMAAQRGLEIVQEYTDRISGAKARRPGLDQMTADARDNTVRFHNLVMQIERAEWRPTLAGCKVIIHQHLDQTLTLTVAGHRVGQYSAQGKLLTPLTKKQLKAVEKTLRGKDQNRLSLSTCKSRKLHGIRTLPPPLRRLTINLTGHFICSQKRTFLLANDTDE